MKYRCTALDSPLFGQTFDVDPHAGDGLVHIPVSPAVVCYPEEAFRKDFTPFNEVDDFKHKHAALIHGVIELNVQYKNLKSQLKARKEALLDLMEAAHIDKVVMDNHIINLVEDANTTQFQTAAFKKAYPDLFRRYSISGHRNSYLCIRGRFEKDEV